jgi:hypothetical protein
MYVEVEVEVAVSDPSLTSTDAHDLKLWLQRAFRDNSCYRIASFKPGPKPRSFKAQVAINTRVVPEAQWKPLEEKADPGALAAFVQKMFSGKGTCRCSSPATLKPY